MASIDKKVSFSLQLVFLIAALWSANTNKVVVAQIQGRVSAFIFPSSPSMTCPNEIVTYTCSTTNADTVQWTITLSGGQRNINTFTRAGNQVGESQVFKLVEQYNITVTLTSKNLSDMESTLSTTLSKELDGAEVECLATRSDDGPLGRSLVSSTIIVKGLPAPPQNLMFSELYNRLDSVRVIITWDHSLDLNDFDFPEYIVSTDPATNNRERLDLLSSTVINLEYDTTYTVNVTAVNCAGRSDPATVQLGPYPPDVEFNNEQTTPDSLSIETIDYGEMMDKDISTTNEDRSSSSEPSDSPTVLNRTVIIGVVVGVFVVIAGCLTAGLVAIAAIAVFVHKKSKACKKTMDEMMESRSVTRRHSNLDYCGAYMMSQPVQNEAYNDSNIRPVENDAYNLKALPYIEPIQNKANNKMLSKDNGLADRDEPLYEEMI